MRASCCKKLTEYSLSWICPVISYSVQKMINMNERKWKDCSWNVVWLLIYTSCVKKCAKFDWL